MGLSTTPPILFEVEVDTDNFKKYKSPGSKQITAELIQVIGSSLISETYKLINYVNNMEELPQRWKVSTV
jgi:hypothetical protein